MAKNTARSAAALTIDQAYEIVDADKARIRAERMAKIQAKAQEIAASPTTQKVGIAVAGASIGALVYHVFAG